MNWKKYKLLISGGAVCLVLAVVALVFLFRFKGDAGDAAKRLDNAVKDVRGLKQGGVYPSPENAKALAAHREQLQETLTDLRVSLSQGQVRPQAVDPSRFGIHVTSFRNRLMDPEQVAIIKTEQAAGASSAPAPLRGEAAFSANRTEPEAVEPPDDDAGKVKVAGGFGFGFDAYIIRGERPEAQDIPRLTVQMQLVERVCNVLYEAGVAQLDAINREQFELTAEDLRRRNLAGSRGFESDRGDTGGVEESEVVDPVAHLYRTETMRFQFQTREPALWQVLNLLASHPDSFVVQTVSIRNLNPNEALQPQLETAKTTGKAARRSARSRRSVTPSRSRTGTEEELILPGKELVEVVVQLDAILFTPPEVVETEGGTAVPSPVSAEGEG